MGKHEGNRPLERSRSVCEFNFTTGLKEIGWGLSCTDLTQNRDAWQAVVNAAMNLRIL